MKFEMPTKYPRRDVGFSVEYVSLEHGVVA